QRSVDHPDLHSFPTRRSSDLRARTALAKKAGVAVADVTRVTIWGNHSNTQYPDFTNARIKGRPATEVITDRAWLEGTFVPQVQTDRKSTRLNSSHDQISYAVF